MKAVINHIIFILVAIAIIGCQRIQSNEFKILIKNLAMANKKLLINEIKTIKLYDFYDDNLKIITPPYISKDEFMSVVKDVELCEKLAWITASEECCHLFVIDNNKLIASLCLPGYVDVGDEIMYSSNKDISIKVKKIDRKFRPLIIEDLLKMDNYKSD